MHVHALVLLGTQQSAFQKLLFMKLTHLEMENFQLVKLLFGQFPAICKFPLALSRFRKEGVQRFHIPTSFVKLSSYFIVSYCYDTD